jgi:hypothetical protein
MKVGIDFDNTIVCYDEVFYRAALEKRLIPSDLIPSKMTVKEHLCSTGQHDVWTELQGDVYGARMDLARPFPGVDEFFQNCCRKNIDAVIVSHKTKFPCMGPQYDLHETARRWLVEQKFKGSPPIYFESTQQEKLHRIAELKCSIFIDDLLEVFLNPDFPSFVQKVLFDPNHQHAEGKYLHVHSWKELWQQLS